MKTSSNNKEFYTCTAQLIDLFNEMPIIKVNNGVQETISVPCVYGQRSRILKSLESRDKTLLLPISSLCITSITRDSRRVNSVNEQALLDRFNIKNEIPTPINIGYEVTMATKNQKDLDQMICNFVSIMNPDVYVVWKNPRGSANIISRIIWDGDIKVTYNEEITPEKPWVEYAVANFIYKTWVFAGIGERENDWAGKPIKTVNTSTIGSVVNGVINAELSGLSGMELSAAISGSLNVIEGFYDVPTYITFDEYYENIKNGLIKRPYYDDPMNPITSGGSVSGINEDIGISNNEIIEGAPFGMTIPWSVFIKRDIGINGDIWKWSIRDKTSTSSYAGRIINRDSSPIYVNAPEWTIFNTDGYVYASIPILENGKYDELNVSFSHSDQPINEYNENNTILNLELGRILTEQSGKRIIQTWLQGDVREIPESGISETFVQEFNNYVSITNNSLSSLSSENITIFETIENLSAEIINLSGNSQTAESTTPFMLVKSATTGKVDVLDQGTSTSYAGRIVRRDTFGGNIQWINKASSLTDTYIYLCLECDPTWDFVLYGTHTIIGSYTTKKQYVIDEENGTYTRNILLGTNIGGVIRQWWYGDVYADIESSGNVQVNATTIDTYDKIEYDAINKKLVQKQYTMNVYLNGNNEIQLAQIAKSPSTVDIAEIVDYP